MSLILEKRGFVTVKKDNCDNRIVRVTITKQCEEYFNGIYERSKDFIENLFQGFDDEILKIFYNGFIRLENNVIKMEDLYKDEKGGIE
jgi:DNA-binding MarR family transcriptional regulator